MTVYLNGQFVPEDAAVISVFDRSFRYGDGLFETVLLHAGKPFRWPQHFDRLRRSAEFLKLTIARTQHELLSAIVDLAARNNLTQGLVRVTLSRGVGPHGYAPPVNAEPTIVITTQSLPPKRTAPWKLITCSLRVAPDDPLLQHKTASRLLNVLAAQQARDAGADDALILDTNGRVVDGSTSNLFWIADQTVCTIPVADGALPGVTRATVLELCATLRIPTAEHHATVPDLLNADAVFLTLTSRGAVTAATLDTLPLNSSCLTGKISAAYEALLNAESQ